jgi:uncharacterized membrane protein
MNTVTLTAPLAPSITEKTRLSSIDLMRGIVMVIMALDHVRDFFHLGAVANNPTDMATTTPALFFTRWITHYCAPTFVLLAGTSIFLTSLRKPKKELTMFLLTRGLWLMVLEVVVVRFGLLFNFYYDVIIFQVIWVIGASMMCMALLIHLPYRAILAIGFCIVLAHNIGDYFRLEPSLPFFGVWTVLRQFGFVQLSEGTALLAFYPLLPWLGIMMLGYCLGLFYSSKYHLNARKKALFKLGLSAIALFIVIRFVNVYGDPAPWAVQKDGVYTLMSFLNTTKYPPSLLYSLMTLGPVLVVLSWLEGKKLSFLQPLEVFGRVPLFYYILHFYIIHAVALWFFMQKTGRSLNQIDFHFNQSFGGLTPEAGYTLGWVYLVWIVLVLILYPVCRWYNDYKSKHRHWWLSYL